MKNIDEHRVSFSLCFMVKKTPNIKLKRKKNNLHNCFFMMISIRHDKDTMGLQCLFVEILLYTANISGYVAQINLMQNQWYK
jgi:hypothetical protein